LQNSLEGVADIREALRFDSTPLGLKTFARFTQGSPEDGATLICCFHLVRMAFAKRQKWGPPFAPAGANGGGGGVIVQPWDRSSP
jgi:hypothetical protein